MYTLFATSELFLIHNNIHRYILTILIYIILSLYTNTTIVVMTLYYTILYYSASHGRLPDSTNTTDITSLQEHLTTLQSTNNIPSDNNTILTMAQSQQLEYLCRVAGSASVLACSILGSFLSQEVVKAVSHTGEPAFNVFVFSGEDLEAKAFPIR